MGVEISIAPSSIRYFRKTKAVTIAWYARVSGIDDVVKLAIIAPPNDVKKKRILKEWFKTIPERVESNYDDLIKRIEHIRTWWDE